MFRNKVSKIQKSSSYMVFKVGAIIACIETLDDQQPQADDAKSEPFHVRRNISKK